MRTHPVHAPRVDIHNPAHRGYMTSIRYLLYRERWRGVRRYGI